MTLSGTRGVKLHSLEEGVSAHSIWNSSVIENDLFLILQSFSIMDLRICFIFRL